MQCRAVGYDSQLSGRPEHCSAAPSQAQPGSPSQVGRSSNRAQPHASPWQTQPEPSPTQLAVQRSHEQPVCRRHSSVVRSIEQGVATPVHGGVSAGRTVVHQHPACWKQRASEGWSAQAVGSP